MATLDQVMKIDEATELVKAAGKLTASLGEVAVACTVCLAEKEELARARREYVEAASRELRRRHGEKAYRDSVVCKGDHKDEDNGGA